MGESNKIYGEDVSQLACLEVVVLHFFSANEVKFLRTKFWILTLIDLGVFANFQKFGLKILNHCYLHNYAYFVRPAARGLVVTTEYYWDLLRKNMLCKCMGLVFAMGENCFEKIGFYQKRNFIKK